LKKDKKKINTPKQDIYILPNINEQAIQENAKRWNINPIRFDS